MSVLQNGDLDSGDISLALPAITGQLNFLVNTVRNSAFSDNCLEPEALHGLANILEDIEGDLQKINDALYPLKESQGRHEIQGGNV